MKVIIELKRGWRLPTYDPATHPRLMGDWEPGSNTVSVPLGSPDPRYPEAESFEIPLTSVKFMARLREQASPARKP